MTYLPPQQPRVVCTIEARMTSSRLPGKVLMPAAGKPLLQILIERLKRVKRLDGIVLATTVNSKDDALAKLGQAAGIQVFRGSEDDVLGRVCGALQSANADVCVEITADCPLMDPALVEEAIAEYFRTEQNNRYISNADPHRSVPDGLDIQVFSAHALYHLAEQTRDPLDREHVSYGFYRPESGNTWAPRWITHAATRGAESLSLTLDYPEDYELIRRCHESLSAVSTTYGAKDIIDWVRAHPELEEPCISARRTKLNA